MLPPGYERFSPKKLVFFTNFSKLSAKNVRFTGRKAHFRLKKTTQKVDFRGGKLQFCTRFLRKMSKKIVDLEAEIII